MLLTEARRPVRLSGGALVPLDHQDRSRWNRALIAEGAGLIEATLAASSGLGPYQLQAAIAALHRADAVRGFLLERAGDRVAAAEAHLAAARRATSEAERAHLWSRVAMLSEPSTGSGE